MRKTVVNILKYWLQNDLTVDECVTEEQFHIHAKDAGLTIKYDSYGWLWSDLYIFEGNATRDLIEYTIEITGIAIFCEEKGWYDVNVDLDDELKRIARQVFDKYMMEAVEEFEYERAG